MAHSEGPPEYTETLVKADSKFDWRDIDSLTVRASSSLWTVVGLLAGSEFVYVKLIRLEAVSTTRSVVTFLALIAILFLFYGAAYLVLRNYRESLPRALAVVIVGAILFRTTLLFAGIPPHAKYDEATSRLRADLRSEAVTYDSYLLFDNDIWRYLWDGHVGARGLNPYRFEPRNPELDKLAATQSNTLWGDIRANVNHPDVPTIYPPFAQLIFRIAHAIAPGSVLAMKLVLVACDLLSVMICVFTLRALHRPVTEVVLYAWNPLIIKAVAGSGHVDAALAMFLMAMVYFVVRGSRSFAAVAWGLSILVKMSPIVLLPFLIRRLGWRKTSVGAIVVMIGYAPYADLNGTPFVGLRTFANEWQFNSGFFSLIEGLASPFCSNPVLLAKIAAVVVFLALMTWLIYLDDAEDKTFAFFTVSALGGMLVLSPTVMPWYLVWIVPLAVIARTSAWIQFSPLACLAFLVMIDGTERTWILFAEYGIFAVLLWREYAKRQSLKNKQESAVCRKSTQSTQEFRWFVSGGRT